ncbi:MAG: DEAD/DEAH box helicase family protein [Nitrososphaerota archaeon]|jgi:superfamily II DNA or RNA helicase|nr:DEAD/DEAH box helicase family protein [Nitrososphaerota archaeon]MDG6931853.1 DEAD/DEAH box helicase family protein [Nitrososphaerota archaeon]MDG6936627.1 DEAD/DEAH box helicase family protein [Nitrososphaerota archaeon]MDG6944421.1 DEAD/DEAH box helicase family protein [Nitrososphaerota archaeon]
MNGRVDLPFVKFDERSGNYRCLGIEYRDLKEGLERSGTEYVDEVLDASPPDAIHFHGALRKYQGEALERWKSAGMRGVIVLPTGGGKTMIALRAIYDLRERALILVPTIDLMNQWTRNVNEVLGIKAGELGGGSHEIQPVTVSTYDSALSNIMYVGNRFSLLIADECHHLPAPSYSEIALYSVAPHRMGLSATPERDDGLHRELKNLLGPVVYRLSPGDLAGTYLSEFKLRRITVDLNEDELREYNKNYGVYSSYLKSRGIIMRSPRSLLRLVMLSTRDPEARRALLARNEAIRISLNARSKVDALITILEEYRGKSVIVFTQNNELVYRVSQMLLVPAITHVTPKPEREFILKSFREGRYRVIITSKVLDEGIDVPDASVGVIMSGTGSSREFIQRLGRILRKVSGKQAELIEIVTRNTTEPRASYRRKKSMMSDAD